MRHRIESCNIQIICGQLLLIATVNYEQKYDEKKGVEASRRLQRLASLPTTGGRFYARRRTGLMTANRRDIRLDARKFFPTRHDARKKATSRVLVCVFSRRRARAN